MLISERIYKYLEEKGMSQIDFANRTGISQSTISDWKRRGKDSAYCNGDVWRTRHKRTA